MNSMGALGTLFLSALFAATIFPAQSEALLIVLLRSGEHSTAALLFSASLGNILGSLINYWLGRAADRLSDKKWFPVSAQTLAKARTRYARYGRWSLLLSWAPIIGDPLTVAAGLMREPLVSFLALVALAKVGRYLVVAAITLNLF